MIIELDLWDSNINRGAGFVCKPNPYRLNLPNLHLPTKFEKRTMVRTTPRTALFLPWILLLRHLSDHVQAFVSILHRHPNPSSTVQPATPGISGPDPATKPDFDTLSGPLGKQMDDILLKVFHDKLSEEVFPGQTPKKNATFEHIVELTHHLVRTSPSAEHIQRASQNVLRSLFPSWLPPQYKILFSRPFPQFSAEMNAAVTWAASTWLMGSSTLNTTTTVHVERCRFLEESGCISVCVNACQIPTQNFFAQDMGLPLTMEPDYETFACDFRFGEMPPTEQQPTAPCLLQCPSAGVYRHGISSSSSSSSSKTSPVGNVTATTTVLG